jgi:multidrug efflux pump subunit AcrA (membrane-fusion protein)
MKKQHWIGLIVVLAIVGLWAAKKIFKSNDTKQTTTFTEVKGANYWTCPMHPQIHSDHVGECPICHMKLIQVKAQEVQTQQNSRAAIQVSPDRLALIGVQKEVVEQMDLNLKIPVSGRLLSSSTVAFQVYESDLKYIKAGLSFRGTDGEDSISGVINSVDSIVDPTSRTVRVVGSIEKGPRGLISETTFSGVVEIVLRNRVSIPESSVLHTGTGDLVYVFTEGNKLSAREVKLGAKTEGFYVVNSGLQPGEFISSGPNFLIDSEAKIRGTSQASEASGKLKAPECPGDQHWDTPMAMCMPGKSAK